MLSARTAVLFLTALLLIALLVLFGFILLPKEIVSIEENRSLTAFPTPSPEGLLYGKQKETLESYACDHFPLRDVWLRVKRRATLLTGSGETGGVLYAEDGYLVPRLDYTEEDYACLRRNLAALSSLAAWFSAEGNPTVFALAPRTVDVLSSSLPRAYATTRSEHLERVLNTEFPETHLLASCLRERHRRGEAVMYRTDHHWTSLGAYYAYTALAPMLGVSPVPIDTFERVCVKRDFYGTAQSSSGATKEALPYGDMIELFRYAGDDLLTVTVPDTGDCRSGLYRPEYLSEKDAYRVFLGGNHGAVSVTREDKERPRLLLLHDSFSLSLLPFLSYHFDVDLIDPRYHVGDLPSPSQYDAVLLLFGIDTCAKNAAIHRYCRRVL